MVRLYRRTRRGGVAPEGIVRTLQVCLDRILWDRCVLPACWIQRVTSDSSLPSFPTTFRRLFDRNARMQVGSITPVVKYEEGRQKQPGLLRRRCRWRYSLMISQQYSGGP